jgi:hypothetical protein
MKNIWRFIVFWRFLLLACLVLVGAGYYLWFGLPDLSFPSPPQPSSLPGKYEKIERGMTESQVIEILGPPQSRVEDTMTDLKWLTWTEGQDVIVVRFIWTDRATVIDKKFRTRSAQPTARGEQ